MKITIGITHTESQETKSVDIAPTGASIAEICKAGGIETKDKDFTVNGKPATLDTHVGKDDILAARGRNPPVTVSARPQGS